MKQILSIIVAVGENGEIGRGGDLVWRIREDLKRFKFLTMGHPVVMGRKTWESLPKALPGRTNIIVTRNPEYRAEGALTASSVDDALRLAAAAEGGDEVFIMGGGSLYAASAGMADRLYLTRIHASCGDADTCFPAIDPEEWNVRYKSERMAAADGVEYTYENLERR